MCTPAEQLWEQDQNQTCFCFGSPLFKNAAEFLVKTLHEALSFSSNKLGQPHRLTQDPRPPLFKRTHVDRSTMTIDVDSPPIAGASGPALRRVHLQRLMAFGVALALSTFAAWEVMLSLWTARAGPGRIFGDIPLLLVGSRTGCIASHSVALDRPTFYFARVSAQRRKRHRRIAGTCREVVFCDLEDVQRAAATGAAAPAVVNCHSRSRYEIPELLQQ